MYKKRLIEKKLTEYLEMFSAVLVEGAKGVGKTSTCTLYSSTIFSLDDKNVLSVVENDMDIIKNSTPTVLIDEWQKSSNVWNYTKRLVDKGLAEGSIILTGSNPRIDTSAHSGALRIVRLKMRPFTIEEKNMSDSYIRISDILNGNIEMHGTTNYTLTSYIDEIYRSGFPLLQNLSDKKNKVLLENYIEYMIKHDFVEIGFDVRSPLSLKAWLKIYACSIATITSNKTIWELSTKNSTLAPSRNTANSYINALNLLNIIDEVEPWLPINDIFKNVGRTPKHFLVDASLALSILGVDKDKLMFFDNYKEMKKFKPTYVGQLFESFVYQSLVVYAEVNDAKLYHFRTSRGDREVDFIIEKGNKLLLVEVKAKSMIENEDVKHLNWFEEQAKGKYKIIKLAIYCGTMAYTRKDNVYVIPAALLGC